MYGRNIITYCIYLSARRTCYPQFQGVERGLSSIFPWIKNTEMWDLYKSGVCHLAQFTMTSQCAIHGFTQGSRLALYLQNVQIANPSGSVHICNGGSIAMFARFDSTPCNHNGTVTDIMDAGFLKGDNH